MAICLIYLIWQQMILTRNDERCSLKLLLHTYIYLFTVVIMQFFRVEFIEIKFFKLSLPLLINKLLFSKMVAKYFSSAQKKFCFWKVYLLTKWLDVPSQVLLKKNLLPTGFLQNFSIDFRYSEFEWAICDDKDNIFSS